MRFWKAALGAGTFALALAGCGGGGGSEGDGSPGVTPTPNPTTVQLSFVPSAVNVNQQFGTSTTFAVNASVANPAAIDGELHVQVIDADGVLSGTAPRFQQSGSTMTVTAQTQGALALGRHTGEFQVRLCRDAACASPYAGSPFALGYEINVAAQALGAAARVVTSSSVYAGGTVADPVIVDVTGLPEQWKASTTATWLTLAGAAGAGNGAFDVRYVATGLDAGTHQAMVTVRASDGQSVDLPFTLTVMPSQFTVNGGMLVFTAVNGAPIPPQQLEFQLAGSPDARWTVTPSVPWLSATPLSGTVAAPVELTVRPDVGPLVSGTYTAQLGLRAPGMTEDKVVPVQLNLLRPTLLLNSPVVTIGGPLGRDLGPAVVPISLNTGTETHPFALESLPAWMDGSTRSGRVGQTGGQLSLVAATDTPGTRTATPTLKATVNGDVIAMPLTVTANRDQRRLLASQWGVGFSSTPRGDVLARTLTIRQNFGDAVQWTAVSDKPWLSVTGGGTTSGASTLALTANPASLADATLEVATVTVRTSDTSIQPAVVRVALWKDAHGLPALVQQPVPYVRMVTDPIRPYVYAHDGGSTIDILNIYTAQKVGSIVAGTNLSHMAVSRDGMSLYAVDFPSSTAGVFDLATLAKRETITLLGNATQSAWMTIGRVNGIDLLFFSTRRVYKGNREFADFPDRNASGYAVVSGSGKRLYVQVDAMGKAYDIDYSEVGGGTLTAVPYNRVAYHNYLGGNTSGAVLSPDDGTLYLTGPSAIYPADIRGFGAPTAPYEHFDTDPAMFTNDSHLGGIAVTHDGHIVAVYIGAGTDASMVYVYTPDGTVKSTQYVSHGVPEKMQLGVSPDGGVAAMLTDSSYVGRRITFTPIAP